MNEFKKKINNFISKYWFEISISIFGSASFSFVFFLDKIFTGYTLDKNYSVMSLTAIPLFFITVIHLYWGVRSSSKSLQKSIIEQKSTIVRGFVSSFHTNEYLQDIYFDLVYSYDDEIYNQVINDESYKQDSTEKSEKIKRPFFVEKINEGRKIGSRYYHPRYFQLSLEEKKLDSLLGFFDVVAYQYSKRILSLEDILGTVGYYLVVINARKASKAYLDYIETEWRNTPYGKSGAKQPYSHLLNLLKNIDKEMEKRKKEEQTTNQTIENERAGIASIENEQQWGKQNEP